MAADTSGVFLEVYEDSDSEDDIPLAELCPLASVRPRDPGSDRDDEDDDENKENNDDSQDINHGSGANNPQPGQAGLFTSLSAAYFHPWLLDFAHENGPHMWQGGTFSEFDVFSKLINDQVINLFVTETNRYAGQYLALHPNLPTHALARKWVPTNESEMKAFIGTLYYMGIVKMPSYQMYWNTEYLTEIKGFRGIMSRDRWMLLWQFFHVVNNEGMVPRDDPAFDKLFKIKPLMKILIQNWQENYYPGKNVSVDESIIAFKGRTNMMQYMPQKPHKWGIKAWVLAEAKTGYIYNWEVYRGATGNTETGLTKNVVMDICKPIYGNRHHVYMDNYFSSPELYESLAQQELGACGTLRVNRIGVPDIIKRAKMSRGDPPISAQDGKLQFISWQDKKQVNLISTIHNTQTFEKKVKTKDPLNNNEKTVVKPKAVELYNQFMGGVDLIDQKLLVYLSIHRTVKWWKKILIYLLEASIINTTIIWQKLNPGVRYRADKFRLNIIKGLVGTYDRHPPISRNLGVDVPGRLLGRHFIGRNLQKTPKGRQSKPDCCVCSSRVGQRHQTEFICKQCRVPLHPYPCFERYHSLRDFRVECTKQLHAT